MSTDSNSPLRYTYEDVAEHKFHKFEFGVPLHRYTLHKLPDATIVASYNGHRFWEWHPDGSQYLVYNADTHSSGTTIRYEYVMRNVSVGTRFMRRANGAKGVSLQFTQSGFDANARRYTPLRTSTATGSGRFKMTADNNMLAAQSIASGEPQRIRDNDKYRVFNRQLKELRAVITAQIKTGAYDKEINLRRYSYSADAESLTLEIQSVLNIQRAYPGLVAHVSHRDVEDKMYEWVQKWIDVRAADLLRPIMLACLHNHTSNSSEQNGALCRLKSGLISVQQRYLREHCVKISASNNSLSLSNESDDQNSELFAPSGLREVQVPSEAQVC